MKRFYAACIDGKGADIIKWYKSRGQAKKSCARHKKEGFVFVAISFMGIASNKGPIKTIDECWCINTGKKKVNRIRGKIMPTTVNVSGMNYKKSIDMMIEYKLVC